MHQSQQQEQGHKQGPGLRQQRGEGQHQQHSSGGVTPPPTAQSPSQFFTQQGTPLTASASQGEVLRPQWVQQVQQEPEQLHDGSQARQSMQDEQDVLQPSPPGFGPSSSSSLQQQGQHISLVRATERASPHLQQPLPSNNLEHDSAPRSSLQSQVTTDPDGPQLRSSQPSNPVKLESHPGPSSQAAAPLHSSDNGKSSRPVGGCSSWLQYLQQQYSRLSVQDPQRVTLVGAVTG
jgi:hypothetical protein